MTSRARMSVGALALPAAAAAMLFMVPRASGVGWGVTGDRVEDVSLLQICLLITVWAAGLWLHTLVLRASLPGLGTRRAFVLNLGGSSVSNVLPLGGAAGVGLNYAMLRSWGYSGTEISAFATVSNFVVAIVKVLVAAAGVAALALMPSLAAGHPALMLLRASLLVVLLLAAAGAILVAAGVATGWGGIRLARAQDAARRTFTTAIGAVRQGWRLMTLGGVGYPVLQALLLWLCLDSTGASVTVVAALLAFAVERLATLVPLTPGGVGVAEAAAITVLVAFGADPAAAAAGVVLFRLFSFFVEIPLGGVVAMLWLTARRRA